MAVSLSPNETVTVLRLTGNIGPEEMDALAGILMDLVLENKTRVVLNFHQVRHISLNAISKLVDRNQRYRALGGEIKLVGLTPYVTNLFKLVGAFSQFDVLAYEEEAAARFES
jgi:anti-sigma B factor antagonist